MKMIGRVDEYNSSKSLHITMITTYGIQNKNYSNEITQNSITMNSLFDSRIFRQSKYNFGGL